jgi:hypothetical protein
MVRIQTRRRQGLMRPYSGDYGYRWFHLALVPFPSRWSEKFFRAFYALINQRNCLAAKSAGSARPTYLLVCKGFR